MVLNYWCMEVDVIICANLGNLLPVANCCKWVLTDSFLQCTIHVVQSVCTFYLHILVGTHMTLLLLQRNGTIYRLDNLYLSKVESPPFGAKYCFYLHVPHEANERK